MTSSTEIDHSDHHPAIVSSESVEMQVRKDPYSSEPSEELLDKPKIRITSKCGETRIIPTYRNIPEWLPEFRENPVELLNTETQASSSHELFF